MTDLRELYQEVILDHNRSPRNFRAMEAADRRVEGRNPLCGDEVTLWVRLDGDVIADVSFLGSGCAISKASASLMTAAVKGKTRADAEALFYMKSRGVNRTLARQLLTYAFAADVLETIEVGEVREELEALTLKRFTGEEAPAAVADG